MLNEDGLRDCWREIKQHAAYGVDRGSAHEYAHNLEDNITHPVERLTSTRSRATRVRRHEIPPGGGRFRPLGMPVVEETRVQLAVRGSSRPSTSRTSGAGAMALGLRWVPLLRSIP